LPSLASEVSNGDQPPMRIDCGTMNLFRYKGGAGPQRDAKGITAASVLITLLLVMLFVRVPFAHADSYDLNVDFCTGGCGSGPAGTVDLTQNGGNVDVRVHLLNNNQFLKSSTGAGQYFLFNARGITQFSIINLMADTAPFGEAGWAQSLGSVSNPPASLIVGGTGTWQFGIGCPRCSNGFNYSHMNADITFTVLNVQIADLTVPNAKGFVFAVDEIAGGLPTGNNGPVAATIPEPTTFALLAGGLILLGYLSRKPSGG
jgi:hypothetical protein